MAHSWEISAEPGIGYVKVDGVTFEVPSYQPGMLVADYDSDFAVFVLSAMEDGWTPSSEELRCAVAALVAVGITAEDIRDVFGDRV